MAKKVFVSGCYDLLHSGHVEFFRQAAQFGDLYVGIGSDATILGYKHHKTVYSEQERLFMVKSIRYVKDAYINAGSGVLDFLPTLDIVKPDVLVVNEDGSSPEKERICRERGIEYVVLQRVPHVVSESGFGCAGAAGAAVAGASCGAGGTAGASCGAGGAAAAGQAGESSAGVSCGAGGTAAGASGMSLPARSSTALKQIASRVPTRLDLAGTWIDQPYVSCLAPGWAITISLEPTFEIRERCGLATSTRNMIKKIWPYNLPNMDPEMLAKLVFCFENDPERSDGITSGAQDSIGICVPGLCRHYYNGRFWPEKIEVCSDEAVLSWLEDHLAMIPMEPRRPGCSVIEGKRLDAGRVAALASAAARCWDAILARDLAAFAAAYRASFEAQVAIFPAMVRPVMPGENAQGAGSGAEFPRGCSASPECVANPSRGAEHGAEVSRECSASPECVANPSQGAENGAEVPRGCSGSPECVANPSQGAESLAGADSQGYILDFIAKWSAEPGVLAWKMPGAGGGGYLACVVEDAATFAATHPEAIRLIIRRAGM